jgi:hypothetical protein
MKYQIEDTLYESIVVESPKIFKKDHFEILGNHIKQYVPDVYKTQIGGSLEPGVLSTLFRERGLLLFCFENDVLVQMSTLPYNTSYYYDDKISVIDYIKQLSLYKPNLSHDRENNIKALLNSTIETNLNANRN